MTGIIAPGSYNLRSSGVVQLTPLFFSATAEISNTSGTAISYGHPPLNDNHRDLTLTVTVAQHLFHPAGIELDVIIDMIGMRLTGAGGVGSALLAVNNYFVVHDVPP